MGREEGNGVGEMLVVLKLERNTLMMLVIVYLLIRRWIETGLLFVNVAAITNEFCQSALSQNRLQSHVVSGAGYLLTETKRLRLWH